MTRCPRCPRGRLWSDDGRMVCHLCSYVAADPVGTVEKIISNAKPEENWLDAHTPYGPRETPPLPPVPPRRLP
jgi:hypothetical protein